MRNLTFIGLGLMGRGMARSLLRNGFPVTVYNRTRAKAEEVAAAGAQLAASPAEATRGSDVVLTMLADPAAVNACFEGPDGILATLQPNAVVIDSSTISAPASQRIAEMVRARSAHFLDAPVFGSRNEAETGTLGFMVGGERAIFDSVQDVFGCLGKSTYMGPNGMGVSAKLVVNLIIASSIEAFNEGMVLATRAGLDPDLMYSIIMGSRARCGIFEMKGPPTLKRDFTPFFPLKLMEKDLRLALETGESLSVPLPVVQAARQAFAACVADGLGEEDFSASIKHLEKIAQVEVSGGSNL